MKIEHNFYDYSDLSFNIYNFAINYWKEARPNLKVQKIYEVPYSELGIFRVFINSIALQIARTNEIINDLYNNSNKKFYLKKIDSYFDALSYSLKINTTVDMTNDAKRQQIKNCLAHANFKIIEYPNETLLNKRFFLKLENNLISAEISFTDLEKMLNFFISISDELDCSKKELSGVNDFLSLKTNNIMVLRNAIDKIGWQPINLASSMPSPKYLTPLNLFANEEIEYLSSDEKTLIEDFIKYIGIQNWISSDYHIKTMLFARQIKFLLQKQVDLRTNMEYISVVMENLITQGKRQKELDYYKFEAPMAYASVILDYGYFCFNYLREANKKEKLDNFNFINFPLNGIILDSEYLNCIKTVDEKEIILSDIKIKKLKIEKLNKEVIKEKMNRDNICLSNNLDIHKKEELMDQKNAIIRAKQNEAEDLKIKCYELLDSLEQAEVYTDSSQLFRHLRNSFAHGFYSIDYSKALKTKNLENIVFTFCDYAVSKETEENKIKNFELKITAKRLILLLNDFSTRIKSDINVTLSENLEMFVAMSKKKEIPNYVKEKLKLYEMDGKTITRI